MKLTIKSRQFTITEDIEQHFQRKLQRLDKYFNREVEAFVNCSREKGQERVEITLVGAGIDMRAEDRAGDLYSALDLTTERLVRQIERYKTRLEQRRQNRESIRKAVPAPLPEVEEVVTEVEEARIVRSKRFALTPMDPEEACLQMELLGHSFFVFLNVDTGAVNVVYRRNDGNYGLIEPEI
ncbi:MAG: ribosome-associated translation inhibitor RaiA [Symbiobacteriaceae bacterium]|nr:ribosome-associated translation inhibitor RaiA [Symbiobacteriaceae bacterium]